MTARDKKTTMSAEDEIKRLRRSVAAAAKRRPEIGEKPLVFGTGPAPNPVMIVGEAPGRMETRQGKPFVGKAGSFFVSILEEISGRPRDDFYITNVIKFWPTLPTKRLKTRPPSKEERSFFAPYLEREIEAVSPEVIVAVGKTAFTALVPECDFTPGEWTKTPTGVPVMPVYHPAYILRRQKVLLENSEGLRKALKKALIKAGLYGRGKAYKSGRKNGSKD